MLNSRVVSEFPLCDQELSLRALHNASPPWEMQEFYDAAFPRLEAANKYLEQFPVRDRPEPERNLLLLMMSLVLVSFPVEVWQRPRVPDSGAAYLDLVVEPKV